MNEIWMCSVKTYTRNCRAWTNHARIEIRI